MVVPIGTEEKRHRYFESQRVYALTGNKQLDCPSNPRHLTDPGWLGELIKRDYDIYCGFDADEVGNEMARQMIHLHPQVKRLSPPGHDWNDVLTARL